MSEGKERKKHFKTYPSLTQTMLMAEAEKGEKLTRDETLSIFRRTRKAIQKNLKRSKINE